MNTLAHDEFRTPRPIAGWRVVFTAFSMALFAWGLGFYGLSVYLQYLGRAGRFSPALLSVATTFYFLVGALALFGIEHAVTRLGRRRVSIAGVLLLASCASALAHAPNGVVLFALYAGMAVGWAATSGTAVAHIVGRWFDLRRGLALGLALTGASAAGFLIVPLMVAFIARLGMAPGVFALAALLSAALLVLMHFNLVEPDAAPAAGAGGAAAPVLTPVPIDAALLRVCALFAIGWFAQVAFLAQQLPLLVPKVDAAWATLAVATTTASALLGRLVLALFIDRVSHRVATAASFGLQALGSALLLASDQPHAVIAGCALIGFSVGNVITLPALFAQREFAAAHYAQVVTRINSSGQMLYAFGPMVAGLLLARSGNADSTLLACLACQLVAMALCVRINRAA